jgi:hypothetical protein
MTSSALFAQNLEFSIRYNLTEVRYDVYALPDASNPSFFWGPSQISVVVPVTVADSPFSVTSITGGAWQDNSDVYSPAVTPGFDYHSIGSLGASTPLQAGVELLVFHFPIPGANCVPGVRLYINGSDPNSGADGMQGGDFSNTIFGVGSSGGGEYYVGNYDNNGTNCDADGDGTNNDDDDDDPLNPCVDFTAGDEDPTNPIWANADCDGDGVINGNEDTDATDPYDSCSLMLASVSQNATDTGDCDGDGVTNADEINGLDGDFSTLGDNTDQLDPCDYNPADQGTPGAIWNMADCDEDGNPNGSDPNLIVATATDDAGTATPEMAEFINILGNDDFLINYDPANLGTTAITQTGGTAMGTVMFDANIGELTYTPTFGEASTTVTVVYQVCNTDPDPDVCANATVTITVGVADQDSDGDGVLDSDEAMDMTDSSDPCSLVLTSVSENATDMGDCDGDGVTNADEINGTDGDFSTPGDNTNPIDPCSLNLADVSQNATDMGDCDGDGVTNADEINGTDRNFSTSGDSTDPLDPCDYNEADQSAPDAAWNMADCDEDGNPNGSDLNPIAATATDDAGTATPEMAEFIDILGNDDFLGNLDPTNLGFTAITQTGGTAMGTVMFDIDIGELTYTPTVGESGMTVTVVYQVCNTNPNPDVCATATVTIIIGVVDQDSDGDGVLDSDETTDMTDLNDPCSLVLASVSQNATDMGDCDGDGVTNADEINGTDGDFSTPSDNTNPIDPCSLNLADVSQNATDMSDCDGDGVTNADEINGTDDDFSISDDNTDPLDPCDYNEANQITPDAAWNMADCDEDGNPNGSDFNPVVATGTDDEGTAIPNTVVAINILGNDDFLDNLDSENLGTTAITQTGGTAMGTVMFDTDTGDLIYTSIFGESGMTVTVVYQVCNTDPDPDVCATATVTITVADQDSDGDGVLDSDEATDLTDLNDPCSLVLASVSQNATDMGDCDGDGVTNADEINGTDGDFSTPGDNTDPLDPCELNLVDVSQNATDTGDCDGDGVTNADEINGTDDDFSTPDDNTDPLYPCDFNVVDVTLVATSVGDCDGDGVTNADEINGTDDDPSRLGDNTDPNDPCSSNHMDATVVATDTGDCDGDGISNSEEINGPDGDPNSSDDNNNPFNPCDPNSNSAACPAQLQVRVALQGSLFDSGSSLMRDDLRSGGLLPINEPYSALAGRFINFGDGGREATTAAVLMANAGTSNAIVDWVFIELRDATDPTIIVETRSALLQRDGDVVDATDGMSALTFFGFTGDRYHIAVKHRNHLGVMTAEGVIFTSVTVVDFTIATAADLYDLPGALNYDGIEQITTASGIKALWAGNAIADNKLKHQGPNTDNIPILFRVLIDPDNTSSSYNFNNSTGYDLSDINMDGRTKYQGNRNDPSYIFLNLLFRYPLNTVKLYNYDFFVEQIP